MRKILVVGGAGFIGLHTSVAVKEAGFQPVILDNFCNSKKHMIRRFEKIIGEKAHVYEGDCRDVPFLRTIFSKEKTITGVIHFAALKAVGESCEKPLAYYHNNLVGLMSLIQVMQEKRISRLVFSSSCTVYGEPDNLPITEKAARKPAISPYGNTKAISEDILRDCADAGMPLRIVALRYFNPIGAHPSGLIGELPLGVPQNLVPFATQTAAGIRKRLTVFGEDYKTHDGTCIRDYIHVMDLARAHVKALAYLQKKRKKSFYDTVNVGTGKGSSVLDVLRAFESVNDVKVPYRIGPRRKGDLPAIYAGVQKSKKTLGWKAELTLEDALRDAWRWQQNLGKK